MIATIAQPAPAVKYAAAMARSTGQPWGVYRGSRRLLVVMPSASTKKTPIEACHP
ncbi:hypothetical protein [Pseudomonas sp. CM27]|uniref:hypothetical protein n=1 Tax=Pseudomonas sp. CM27 TaxID=2738452 RepID=UPI0015580D2A|nr:hypothetical protein [Pseudomonas sp. CM27]NQD74576.1 hypothetical protein [Pseudomonas sp. CM27]